MSLIQAEFMRHKDDVSGVHVSPEYGRIAADGGGDKLDNILIVVLYARNDAVRRFTGRRRARKSAGAHERGKIIIAGRKAGIERRVVGLFVELIEIFGVTVEGSGRNGEELAKFPDSRVQRIQIRWNAGQYGENIAMNSASEGKVDLPALQIFEPCRKSSEGSDRY